MADKTTTAVAPSDWRDQAIDLVMRAEDAMDETIHGLDLDCDNGPYARQLLWEAQGVLKAHSNILQAGDPYDYDSDAILPAVAMLMGARDMKDAHRALPVMLQPAIDALEAASKILDVASLTYRPVAEAAEVAAA